MNTSRTRKLAMAVFSLSGIAIALTCAEGTRLQPEATEKAGANLCWGVKDASGTFCPTQTITAVPMDKSKNPPTPLPPQQFPPMITAFLGVQPNVIVTGMPDSQGVPACNAAISYIGGEPIKYGTTIGSMYRICNKGGTQKPPAKEADPGKPIGSVTKPPPTPKPCPPPSAVYICRTIGIVGADGKVTFGGQWEPANEEDLKSALSGFLNSKCGEYPTMDPVIKFVGCGEE